MLDKRLFAIYNKVKERSDRHRWLSLFLFSKGSETIMRRKVYLGINNYNEICFADIEIYPKRNITNEFTASFDTSSPVQFTEENVREAVEIFIDCCDTEYKLSLCDDYNCPPSQLVDELTEQYCDDIDEFKELLDCSLFPDTIQIDGEEYCFRAESCGQHDLRNDGMVICVNKELFNYINELWDNYHLKSIPHNKLVRLDKMLDDAENQENLIALDVALSLGKEVTIEPIVFRNEATGQLTYTFNYVIGCYEYSGGYYHNKDTCDKIIDYYEGLAKEQNYDLTVEWEDTLDTIDNNDIEKE